jgi:uncharacterized protein (TIGR03435 family)
LAFEVAAIKLNTSGGPSRAAMQPGGRFTATNAPVFMMVRQAYDLQPYEVLNAPEWIQSEHYDIVAKAPDGVQLDLQTLPLLFRSLLADRFNFKAHIESREMTVYELIFARRDRKLGAKIQPATWDCVSNSAAASAPSSPPSDGPRCARMGTAGHYVMMGYPMTRFATMLTSPAGRPVVDKTGLTGVWNIDIQYTPDQPPNIPTGSAPLPELLAPPAPDAPSLFTAIQEQLGLKLQSGKGAVDVLVIDHIDKPTPD